MLFRMLGFPAGNKVDNLLADLLLDYPIRKVGIAFYAEIDADFDGDAFAPQFGPNWQEVTRERHVSASGLPLSFVTYRNLILRVSGD